MEAKIEGVSDTALWVAHFRALESARTDAVFHDPLAERLVGERGRKIAASMPNKAIMQFVMVLRTLAIDRLIEDAIKLKIDCVVNLGTGLDTRPYRMDLPHDLTWIEVDYPQIINLKNEKLANEKPRCKLERVILDLSLRDSRVKLFQQVTSRFKNILVITEGVIPYLSNDQAADLAQDLFALSEFKYWIMDYYDGGLKRRSPVLKKKMRAAPFKFDASPWIDFFNKRGWKTKDFITMKDEAMKLKRRFPVMLPLSIFYLLSLLMPRGWQEKQARKRGYVLFERQ